MNSIYKTEVGSEIAQIINELEPLMNEIIEKSCVFLQKAFDLLKLKTEILAIPLICHSEIEMLDALSVLLKQGVTTPANLQARTIFESFYYCLFLHSLGPENSQKYSRAYVYEYFKTRMETESRIKKIRESSFVLDHQKLNELLSQQGYKEVISEYEKHENRKAKWFSLFDGPKSIVSLIRQSFRDPEKNSFLIEGELLNYALYSYSVHNSDLTLRIGRSEGGFVMKPLRNTNSIDEFLLIYLRPVENVLGSLGFMFKCNLVPEEWKNEWDLRERYGAQLKKIWRHKDK